MASIFHILLDFLCSYYFLIKYIHLTPLFNWNVKQLFLYLIAEYRTNNNDFNQV